MSGFVVPVGQDETIRHIPKYGGELWYVNDVLGSDGNAGIGPHAPFKTIKAGIAAMASGDALDIAAGTYTQLGLDLNKDFCELWFETGALIDPVSGTALTISGNSCLIQGNHKITPAVGAIGLLVTGNECHIADGKAYQGGTGVKITGTGTIIDMYAVGYPTAIGYDIQGAQTRLYQCSTAGNVATYGYKISNNVDTGVLENCTSVGHATSGYYIDGGSADWTILNCSSGAGDGRWVDVDSANVWSNFSFDNVLTKKITFGGGSPGGINLFKVTGVVEIEYIYGYVTTALNADVGNLKLEIHDGGGSDLTATIGVGGAPLNSFIGKTADIGTAITYKSSAAAYIVENSNYRDPQVVFLIGAKQGTDTFIRCNVSGVATDGAIEFHLKYRPVIDIGFVGAV